MLPAYCQIPPPLADEFPDLSSLASLLLALNALHAFPASFGHSQQISLSLAIRIVNALGRVAVDGHGKGSGAVGNENKFFMLMLKQDSQHIANSHFIWHENKHGGDLHILVCLCILHFTVFICWGGVGCHLAFTSNGINNGTLTMIQAKKQQWRIGQHNQY